jgi:hypothetical protein
MGTVIEGDACTGIEGNGGLRVSKSSEREGRAVVDKCIVELRGGGECVVGGYDGKLIKVWGRGVESDWIKDGEADGEEADEGVGRTRVNDSEVDGANDAFSFCSCTVGSQAPSVGWRNLASAMSTQWDILMRWVKMYRFERRNRASKDY